MGVIRTVHLLMIERCRYFLAHQIFSVKFNGAFCRKGKTVIWTANRSLSLERSHLRLPSSSAAATSPRGTPSTPPPPQLHHRLAAPSRASRPLLHYTWVNTGYNVILIRDLCFYLHRLCYESIRSFCTGSDICYFFQVIILICYWRLGIRKHGARVKRLLQGECSF